MYYCDCLLNFAILFSDSIHIMISVDLLFFRNVSEGNFIYMYVYIHIFIHTCTTMCTHTHIHNLSRGQCWTPSQSIFINIRLHPRGAVGPSSGHHLQHGPDAKVLLLVHMETLTI